MFAGMVAIAQQARATPNASSVLDPAHRPEAPKRPLRVDDGHGEVVIDRLTASAQAVLATFARIEPGDSGAGRRVGSGSRR
jgi:hypothetical protein